MAARAPRLRQSGSSQVPFVIVPPVTATTSRTALSKVPEVTAYFWIVKALTTGTMAADAMHVGAGIPYIASTVFYAIVLAVVFLTWHRSEGTLSIHSIFTARREAFYWAAVLATFALGTAAGDLTAVTFGLGYFASGLLFAAVIAIPALGYFRFGMNAILAFWFAYVITRPLGASFADWLAVSHARGGLSLGTGPVSLVLAALIAAFVAFLSITRKDAPAPVR